MVSKGEEDNMASLPATHELHIFGSINGVDFDMVGQGTGNPNDGYEELNLKSTKGDLQFSPWILVPHIGYGFHQYLPYPDGMSPFQAAMVDGSGYQVHRTMQFEDGASLTVNYRYTYEGSHIKGEAQVKGTGFPADGPVMTNSLTAADWCRSKKTYPNDKTIISTFKWSYTTGNGKRYRSTARTTYTFAKPMAANYLKNQPMYVFRKTELKHSKTELNFKEWQKAFTDVMGMDELYKGSGEGRGSLLTCGDVEENPGPMTEYKPTVRLATRDDVPRAVRTLAAAFADYPATRHTVDPDRHIERVTELQELFLTRVGLDIGKVWVADDGAAVAVWTTPESVEAGAVFAEIGPRMAELSGSRLAAQQQMEGLLAPHRPKEPAWFLATVGVSPDHQGKGLGSAVVLPGVEAAERAGVPAFLETSAPRNLPFYERLGFTVTADVEVPEGPRTWCMTRKPGA
nr:mNeonGreen, puroR [synthetic construct]BAP87012.1 mNeonGreen, puroR [synthetic construct]BAP87013.1 mNeonGreen, puroR [synthetic construct]BAP87014.1 mNeonGreen, puroR [synthetic construct]